MIVRPRDLSRPIGEGGSSAAANGNMRHCLFSGLASGENGSGHSKSAWRLSDIVARRRLTRRADGMNVEIPIRGGGAIAHGPLDRMVLDDCDWLGWRERPIATRVVRS
jgi:hypothetical protein